MAPGEPQPELVSAAVVAVEFRVLGPIAAGSELKSDRRTIAVRQITEPDLGL
jgi:hypothetical protein